MTNASGYNIYQKNKVMTASPAELTLMLYEGAIKFINVAIIGIDQKNIEKAHNNIVKATRIIEEFRNSLDFKYPVAKDFDVVYEYILRRLVEANVHKDKEILEECRTHLRSMRDTWKEVMQTGRPS